MIQQLISDFYADLNYLLSEGKTVVASSSFQTHSIPMLHILSRYEEDIPIYFLQTGFHFPETIAYKNDIAQRYDLVVHELESDISKSRQRDEKNQFYFVSKPGYCCHINKVLPMNNVLTANHVWITGVRKQQSTVRNEMKRFAPGPNGSTRFHPMLDWTTEQIWDYIQEHNIPHHPLGLKGYMSVGCEPCTAPSFTTDGERAGRWAGMKKTECGLHTDLAK